MKTDDYMPKAAAAFDLFFKNLVQYVNQKCAGQSPARNRSRSTGQKREGFSLRVRRPFQGKRAYVRPESLESVLVRDPLCSLLQSRL
jgi:hypothetical protein